MTTRLEDAESIVGKSLAEELEEKAALVGKAELVIKAENDEPAPTSPPASEQITVPSVTVDNPPALEEVVAKLSEQIEQLALLVKSLAVAKADDKDEDDDEEKKKKYPPKEEEKSEVEEIEPVDPQLAMVHMLSDAFAGAMAPLAQKMDILIAAQSARTPPNATPPRRSLSPSEVAPVFRSENKPDPNAPMSVSEYSRKSVGLG